MKLLQSARNFLSQSLVQSNKSPSYSSLMKDDNYELRKYNSAIVAQTIVDSSHEDAGSYAFGTLAGYIFGKNDGNVKIEMTSPVTQVQVSPGKYAVQFYMPSKWTLDTLPKPLDSRVVLKKIPQRTMFSRKYNGGWSEGLYQEQLQQLNEGVRKHNIKVKRGTQPIWARYNSPMAPAPIRTNQILYQVQG